MKLTIDRPSARQADFLRARARYIGFGGARGGGKSWAVRAKATLMALRYPGIKILIVRRTYRELINNHIEALRAQLASVATYNKTDKAFTFINGSSIWFGYCANDSDLDQYQGAEYDIIFIDEATQLRWEWIEKINLAVRGANDFPKRTYFTMNPGGVSHAQFKRLFIDRHFEGSENPDDYVFIRSLVTDNKALLRSQPEYLQTLENLPPKLRRAWLEGDWDIFEGQFFEDFRIDPDAKRAAELGVDPETLRDRHQWCHVIRPFDLNAGERRGWKILRSYDFGYARPFSCAWWALDYDGTFYRILELYGCTSTPNEGVKWTPDEQFRQIRELETSHPWLKGRRIEGVADPAIWDASRGESVAETAARYGVYFSPGDNKRVAGWMQVHYRLQFDENGYARMYVFDTCRAFIRTIPALMYSETHPEDLDTTMEDHCLAGTTLVLTDAGYRPIADMVGTEGRAYSSDHKMHRYHDVRMTRRNADVYAVEFEDGTIIYATDDHRFMTPTGEWVRVRDLEAGDEVMSYESRNYQRHDPKV